MSTAQKARGASGVDPLLVAANHPARHQNGPKPNHPHNANDHHLPCIEHDDPHVLGCAFGVVLQPRGSRQARAWSPFGKVGVWPVW